MATSDGHSTSTLNASRGIQQLYPAQATSDGDGVRIKRSVVHGKLEMFDPFLMLDEIASDDAADYIGGFPEHPHRGFETITYMLAGRMRHRDHMGNEGVLEPGSVQWMTAGRGVLHSEMPEQEDGLLHGFQLWMNLPAKDKMCDPRYQEFAADKIPSVTLDNGGEVRVIAGRYHLNDSTGNGSTHVIKGVINDVATDPSFFDLRLTQQTVTLPIPAGHRALLYVYDGNVSVGGDSSGGNNVVPIGHMAILTDGNSVDLSAQSPTARCLLLAGKPLQEPIANWGPFVMNTREEIEQAVADYRSGTLVG